MSLSINQAQPPLEFISPAFNPAVLRITQLLLPAWINSRTIISQIEAENVQTLVKLINEFQQKKIRFLIAFRHPQTEDPFALAYLFSHIVPKIARQEGIPLKYPVHTHFIYDRGIPLWAGSYVGWFFSRMGGTPIYRGKADWTGLKSARNLFANGHFPMAAAPEGATNGLSEIISPLEPGIAQLGFWCAEDLHKARRSEQVFILPVGIKYSYTNPPWESIDKLLSELEAASGLSVNQNGFDAALPQEILYPRLIGLAVHLLSIMEDFYKRFYHHSPELNILEPETSDGNEAIKLRLKALLDSALKVSEDYFYLQPKGNFNDRCRRVEQAGWNYIFREELKDVKALSIIEKRLADRVAEEANLRMWHMRLVENFVAVTGKYVREKPTAERFAETTLLIWDMVARIKGSNPFKRPKLGKQKVRITIGEPLSISDRFEDYQASRKNARIAVGDFTRDLQKAMEQLTI
ncbi:1-acyl-sn-glycerol-3-phosphate acyltransferase [Plectonema cf. radiosum LEGE 06105]|uniref:1-acyl-sn-glycerol-3-phosphate acyltransferase n=1 Tax=Plectonema cf. radiosum LEGE 06105 TaxID=945769 RepID=A0A8J7JT51_9CYAN|nr:1-acyl-sn-glycerol-3-phosphate acyltransferase [Plectonema radiosum]MBE9211720.1 1-acyl-sn-glycerol-3-phosphate acyltransferase [Plectonema cf. radiosum LEGE 06105]